MNHGFPVVVIHVDWMKTGTPILGPRCILCWSWFLFSKSFTIRVGFGAPELLQPAFLADV
jgi:hypothetical protein